MKKVWQLISSHWIIVLLLTSLTFIFTTTVGRTKLWDWDECLYAGYARTMHESGNLLTNFWNGQVILDKLPLYTVFLQIPLLLTGEDAGMRMVNVVFAILLLISVYVYCAKTFSKRVAIFSVLLMLTTEILVRYLTKISTDIPYALFVFLGFALFTSKVNLQARSFFAGVLFGIAVLVKGFAVLPYVGAMVVISLLYDKKNVIKSTILLGTGFVLTCLPWLLTEYAIYGQKFIDVYFIENIFQRAKYPIEFHFGGRLFYVKSIIRDFFPWILVPIILMIHLAIRFKDKLFKRSTFEAIMKNKVLISIFLCMLLPFISLTMAKTKIEWYAVPIYVFLSIFIAYCLDSIFDKWRIPKIVVVIIGALILIDGAYLALKENRFLDNNIKTDTRVEIAEMAKKEKDDTIHYLVQFSERRAREILNPTLYTSFTWIYGGNACAHYYSQKRVNYYYGVGDFEKRLERGNGLFLIENGDVGLIKGLSVDIIYKNSDFSLFRIE